MNYSSLCLTVPVAFLLDLILGDPSFLPHPVRWMGNAIMAAEPKFRRIGVPFCVSGAFFGIALVAGTWVISVAIVKSAGAIHPVAGFVAETILIYYAISARSLESAAMAIVEPLSRQDLQGSRERIAMIVGRDTSHLEADGISRAAVETVSENLVDGFIAPLFFAAIGGAPLAMVYKMVNTLDSMVGYKNDKYLEFGKFSAKMDDIANYIPARLSIYIIAGAAQILSRKGRDALKTAKGEGANHSSPNAGLPEASFAGALGVKLNGPNYYHGKLVEKPFIGVGNPPVEILHIRRSCDLMLLSSLLWVMAICFCSFVFILLF
jgi:adenosylcobinamide-phosphate synthase